jgi:hypothetical protein
MNNKPILAGCATLLVLAWLWQRKRDVEPGNKSTASGQTEMKALVPIESQSRKAINLPEMQAQRAAFKDEHRLRVAIFRPTIVDDQYVFQLNYEAIPRACINGDIDLIKRHVKSNRSLMWTLEDSQGKPVMSPRVVSVDQLQQSFRQKVKIPVGEAAEYFKLSLCSADDGKSCASMAPISFEQLEAKRDSNLNIKTGLFFTQNFRVDKGGIRVFDSREFKDPNQYLSYAKKIDRNDNAKDFLEKMVEEQKTLRSFPAKIDKDSLQIRLYMRTNQGC